MRSEAKGKTYSEVLALITRRDDGQLQDLSRSVNKRRQRKRCKNEGEHRVLDGVAEVRALSEDSKTRVLAISNLDTLITSEDLAKVAIIGLPSKDADVVLGKGKIKVGWTVCKIKEKDSQPRAAKDLLLQTVKELKSDLAILSEQYKTDDNEFWATDKTGKASLWACGDDPSKLCNVLAGSGFVRARAGYLWVYSCYLALESYTRIIEDIAEDARNRGTVLIAGDFNAWAHEWGCQVTNARGRIFL
ncbi:GL17817 [Drosophila persimilis]|uniref:GL17817 n=1 Tax=Drosophila persimilis TaxID=7234 RepID=B4HD85_DROPE|nr:GL17817 [Drosophila persimilis]